MTNTVLIKRSSTANAVPAAGNLQPGELAINYTDGNLFYKNASNVVTVLASNKFVSVSGNITSGNINTGAVSASGNVTTSNYFIGNGAFITGLPASYSNTDVSNYLASGADSANIVTTGNISGGNLYTSGVLSAAGITSSGSVNLASSGNISLGLISNVHILGGSSGYVLSTDGSGGLTWVAQTSAGVSIVVDNFTGDGSTTQFVLSVIPPSINDTIVNYNGIIQPVTSYTLVGTVLTFSSPPDAGAEIEVTSIQSGGNVTVTDVTGDGSTTQFPLGVTPVGVNYTTVNYNGVIQLRSSYSLNSSNIVFSTAPESGANVEISVLNTTANITVDNFTGDGSTVEFALSVTPTNINGTTINYNGVTQLRSGYALVGSNIVFDAPPVNGSQIEVTIIPTTEAGVAGSNTQVQFNDGGELGASPAFTFNKTNNLLTVGSITTVGNVTSNYYYGNGYYLTGITGGGGGGGSTITVDNFTGNGVQTQFTLSVTPPNINSTTVNYNGVIQLRSGYSLVGSNVVFATPPTNNSKIEVTTVSMNLTGSVAGSNTQVQYNDAGNIAASPAFTFNKTTNAVSTGAMVGSRSNVTVTTSTAIDSFATGTYRGAKYLIQGNDGTDYQASDVLLIHNTTDAFITVNTVCSNISSDVFSVSATVSSGIVVLSATKISAGTVKLNLTPVYVKD